MHSQTLKFTRTAAAITALSSALILGAAMVPGVASAATDQPSAAASAKLTRQEIKLSQDGFNTIRAVRKARLAIFNGDVDGAQKQVAQATADIGKIKADERAMDKSGKWVVVDGQLVVADNFVSTPEKQKHIESSNKKLHEGKVNEAMQELKLAEIDVGYSRLLMPLDATREHLSVAAGLLTAQKYYEANLALKAVEDGLVIDTVALADAPTPGKVPATK